MKYYRVKRYVIEEFEVRANSRKEALLLLKSGDIQDPVSIKVIRETLKCK
jgi:hypothetical protein